MKLEEYQAAIKQKPLLALGLLALCGKGNLQKATLYSPENADEKYNAFCDTLKLKPKPYLLLMESDSLEKETNANGTYHSPSNLIAMSQQTFNAFQSATPNASLTVAHELGHAASHQKHGRRKFMGYAAALFGGLASGNITSSAITAMVQPRDKTAVDLEEPKPATTASNWVAKSAGLIIGVGITKRILNMVSMAEELRADDYAKQLIPRDDIMKAMVGKLEADLIENGQGKNLEVIREQFNQAIANLETSGKIISEKDRDFSWGLTLTDFCTRKSSLKDIVFGFSEPSDAERLKHFFPASFKESTVVQTRG